MNRLSTRARVLLVALIAFAGGAVFGISLTNEFRNAEAVRAGGPHSPDPSSVYLTGLVVLIPVVVVLVLLARVALRPLLDRLAAMAEVIRQLGPQNMGHRLGAEERELEPVVGAVNGMLNRVAAGFEGQRRFTGNASHELRTPLAVQRTVIEVAMTTAEDNTEIQRLGRELLLVNERNERLIEGLLVLAESDRGLPGVVPVRLDSLVSSVLEAHQELAARQGIGLSPTVVERTVPGDPVLLERMIVNLLHNGIKYNRPGGVVTISVGSNPDLVVANTGPMVPAEELAGLFEPFRRLGDDRMRRDGAGLGLSIVRSIVAAHRGRISALAGKSGGLQIEIWLPEA